jgi:hypothetical protein
MQPIAVMGVSISLITNEERFMEDWAVPIAMFLVIGAVLCTYLYLRYRARHEVLATVRHALERGHELTPELLEAVSGDVAGGQRDLRKGVIWLALAVAIGIMSWTFDESDLLGIAALPLLLGIAYLVLWRFSGGKD